MTQLKFPYPRHIDEPNMYESIRLHTVLSDDAITPGEQMKRTDLSVSEDIVCNSQDSFCEEEGHACTSPFAWCNGFVSCNSKFDIRHSLDKLICRPSSFIDCCACGLCVLDADCIQVWTHDEAGCCSKGEPYWMLTLPGALSMIDVDRTKRAESDLYCLLSRSFAHTVPFSGMDEEKN